MDNQEKKQNPGITEEEAESLAPDDNEELEKPAKIGRREGRGGSSSGGGIIDLPPLGG